jgi:hypothetical protein
MVGTEALIVDSLTRSGAMIGPDTIHRDPETVPAFPRSRWTDGSAVPRCTDEDYPK